MTRVLLFIDDEYLQHLLFWALWIPRVSQRNNFHLCHWKTLYVCLITSIWKRDSDRFWWFQFSSKLVSESSETRLIKLEQQNKTKPKNQFWHHFVSPLLRVADPILQPFVSVKVESISNSLSFVFFKILVPFGVKLYAIWSKFYQIHLHSLRSGNKTIDSIIDFSCFSAVGLDFQSQSARVVRSRSFGFGFSKNFDSFAFRNVNWKKNTWKLIEMFFFCLVDSVLKVEFCPFSRILSTIQMLKFAHWPVRNCRLSVKIYRKKNLLKEKKNIRFVQFIGNFHFRFSFVNYFIKRRKFIRSTKLFRNFNRH